MGWLIAQQGQNAEETAEGFAGMVSGVAGFVEDAANSPDFGRWVGYILLAALALWFLRRIGILRG